MLMSNHVVYMGPYNAMTTELASTYMASFGQRVNSTLTHAEVVLKSPNQDTSSIRYVFESPVVPLPDFTAAPDCTRTEAALAKLDELYARARRAGIIMEILAMEPLLQIEQAIQHRIETNRQNAPYRHIDVNQNAMFTDLRISLGAHGLHAKGLSPHAMQVSRLDGSSITPDQELKSDRLALRLARRYSGILRWWHATIITAPED